MSIDQIQITVQPSCADAPSTGTMTVAGARDAIRAALQPLMHDEVVPIRSALGRVLARDCLSTIDVPSHTNSAMDGYALAGADLPSDGVREYPVVATVMAGSRQPVQCGAGECVRIMTGAPMPDGTDTVVMQEQVELVDGQRIRIDARHRAGQNVRQAGEDIAAGSCVFAAGRLLRAADIGVMASLGFGEVSVRRRPKVAFFSTGDELRSIGQPLAEGEVYDSNRYTLYAMLLECGAEAIDFGVVRDDPEALSRAFTEAAAIADVVVTSGGVSVGEADYTKTILERHGEMSFWSIAMKPGRPLTFGKLGAATFFGLPGNPVAVMLTFMQFVRPALRYLASGNWPQTLTVPVASAVDLKKRPGRFEFLRGIIERHDGELRVRPAGAQGSGILTSMSRANCFILLPESCAGVSVGDAVQVQPFDTEL
ncbi:MAG: molybdopterin molybdenumtransferase MoeA [Gammaproteobacteria bacterium]|nr:molybdopterin molybdenumtransferase MoeA [Gammaproteobacteria bacterium]